MRTTLYLVIKFAKLEESELPGPELTHKNIFLFGGALLDWRHFLKEQLKKLKQIGENCRRHGGRLEI